MAVTKEFRQDQRRSERMREIEESDKCGRCNGKVVLIDGERACTSCGLVAKGSVTENRQEWRSFTNEEENRKARTGIPPSLAIPDMGISSLIGRGNRDASGRSLSSSMAKSVERMRTWDRRKGSLDRNFSEAFAQLERLAGKLSVRGEVIEKAAYIYRKAVEAGLVRGRPIALMLPAAMYAACREMEIPRTLKDVAEAANVKKKPLAASYRVIFWEQLDKNMPVQDAVRCVSRIGSAAKVSEKSQRRAFEILKRVDEAGYAAGKDRMGLAAAAVYLGATLEGQNATQDNVAQAANITSVTLRNRYKGIRKILKL